MFDPERILATGLVPDALIRHAIRRRLRATLRELARGGVEAEAQRLEALVADMDSGPIAVATDASRRQHYEVPTAFYERVLGPRLKYSACLWPRGVDTLEAAEEEALAVTCARAEVRDGMRVLDLGCGWGSLSLYLAERFPNCEVTAASHSRTQQAHIWAQAQARGLGNLRPVLADANRLALPGGYDRVLSVEMFEHMRNHRRLLHDVAGLLQPQGKLFIHIFTHRRHAYFYDEQDPRNWMARHFFTGGMMPAQDLLHRFSDDLCVERQWAVNGRHYQRTLEAWLCRMDQHVPELWPLFVASYGRDARRMWTYWRVFFMACAELFGHERGNAWFVSHYLLALQPHRARPVLAGGTPYRVEAVAGL